VVAGAAELADLAAPAQTVPPLFQMAMGRYPVSAQYFPAQRSRQPENPPPTHPQIAPALATLISMEGYSSGSYGLKYH
jgi:hypothetical protein